MRLPTFRTWLAAAAAPGLAVAIAVPAAAQPRTASTPAAAGGTRTVILVLRDQNTKIPVRSAARLAAVRTEQAPLVAQLHSEGATRVVSTSLVNAVIATVPARDVAALAANPAVAKVVPNATIAGPAPVVQEAQAGPGGPARQAGPAVTPPACGTSASPELDPEALTNIHATPAEIGSTAGTGVTVATIADGLDPNNPDFQRDGSSVVKQVDFSGDPAGTPTDGDEMFGDASSIAAQGNQVYDLSQYVSTAHPLPAGCDIRIVGAAPGANVLALKAFATNSTTTNSNILQAINYAATHGVKVINESFGANPFPDTAADLTRQANDAAVAAGITVVVSSGDSGFTNTIASPSTDPRVISVGATTTFRSFAQLAFGGINDPAANGQVADNNISSLSSGGFTQSGGTVDMVAPGDENWALCSPDPTLYTSCVNENGDPSSIELFGGTSEAAPLTSAAAADVIQAYASAHGGTDPSPALVKQILISTATDIGAPTTEQGAGLLNVAAAVKLAKAVSGGSGPAAGSGLLVSPGQINVSQNTKATSTKSISLTNTGTTSVTAQLSTRALTQTLANSHGTFCMQPNTAEPTSGCPANSPGVLPIWSGVPEVFQNESFSVPASAAPDVLEFAADYQFTGQTSLLHFALLGPDGTYEAYSLPQGLGDFGQVEVSNPPPGTWTAVFFTEQDGATDGAVGTSGPVQWDAKTTAYAAASPISPSSVTIPAGGTTTAKVTITSPASAGDTSESVVVSAGSQLTTVPVTVRTAVPTSSRGGSFTGVLTGGNGRGPTGQLNTYVFNVPRNKRDLNVELDLQTDRHDYLIAYLEDPKGQILGYSDNIVVNSSFNPNAPVFSPFVDLYHVNPQAGQWRVLLSWMEPVTGLELSASFHGAVRFNSVRVTGSLPRSGVLKRGKSYTYKLHVTNTTSAPEAYFVDARSSSRVTMTLPNQNPSANAGATRLPLPLPNATTGAPSFPYYFVPAHTSKLEGSVTETSGSAHVNFELSDEPGDPDLEGVSHGKSASVTFSEPEVSPGLWLLDPTEIGPFGTSGAPPARVKDTLKVLAKAFDSAVTSSTGDLWKSAVNRKNNVFPVYLRPGRTATITVRIKPTARVGRHVSGTLYVSDLTLGEVIGAANPDGDDIAAIPYRYRVVR